MLAEILQKYLNDVLGYGVRRCDIEKLSKHLLTFNQECKECKYYELGTDLIYGCTAGYICELEFVILQSHFTPKDGGK